ncbi:MAG: hypothetical protein RR672_11820 [Raoultibacter sp.]
MKDLGVYDDATVIVTSDHGEWYYTLEGLTSATGPILLVKQPSSELDAEKPTVISDLPASHYDILPTVVDAVGGDFGHYEGVPIDELTDGPRPRNYVMNLCDGKVDVALLEYRVEGQALDFSTWKKTGRIWETSN